jgi:UDP-glucose 4-epimerase
MRSPWWTICRAGYRHNVEAGAFHQLRVQQTDEMADVLAGHDAVIHFAAYIAVGESMRVPEMYFDNNVGGSLSLFTAMLRAGVKHLVFSSTAAVYGIPHASPIPESFPIAPVNPYGESKVMVETMLRWFDSIHGCAACVCATSMPAERTPRAASERSTIRRRT